VCTSFWKWSGQRKPAEPRHQLSDTQISAMLTLFTGVRGETVWKLCIGSILWSDEPRRRGEKAPLWTFRTTKLHPIRPDQLVSRQSLERQFSEVRMATVLSG
jgi:hypothetical protein